MHIDQYQGCFLGLALGDTLGAPYEGGPLERLLWKSIGKTKDGKLRYTDDTQMSIDIAASFLKHNAINQDHLALTFAENYQWSRGYGPSAAKLLTLIKKGVHWREANTKKFKLGSFGNGAAMRAPILALCFPNNVSDMLDNVVKSAEITHSHSLGIEGAKLVALTTQHALFNSSNDKIIEDLLLYSEADIYKKKIKTCADLINQSDINTKTVKSTLGNGMAAQESSITAIYFALKFRESYFETMLQSIFKLGGDVDTICAMAGAIWGAANGCRSLLNQAELIEGGTQVLELAEKLFVQR